MPLINGEGFTIAVKENKIDSLGIDFRGRFIRSNLTSSLFSNHAADMATILAGEDNIFAFHAKALRGRQKYVNLFTTLLLELDYFY